jgi:Fe2+ or Zn2+ uptake regulation protein
MKIMNFTQFATNELEKAKYRITQPRLKVLEILAKAKNPLNAYEIAVSFKNYKMDVSTVYRILEVYRKLGLVHFIKGQGFTACKDWECNDKNHCHHQFVCKKCDNVTEVHLEDKDFLETLKTKLAGFSLEDHYFEFSGLCKNCN